jgi:soluble lytic murein transglycosylase
VTPPAAIAPANRKRADARRRSEFHRRRTAVRRRRALAMLVAAAAIIVVVLAMPLFKKAVSEFNLPLTNADVIRQQAAEKHLDPALIAAVIYAETKFDARTSPMGAEGLMQIEPATAEFLARKSGATTFTVADLGTPQVNIAYGSYYLRYLLNVYHQNKMLAVAAYNAGETNVDNWIADARAQGHSLGVNEIPFGQTRAYVLKVLSAEHSYRQAYPSELGYS